jgi:hypothetical protein
LKSDTATAGKAVKQSSRHWKRSAQRKVASKSDETEAKKAADVADAAGDTPAVIPASVANANAQLTSDGPADSATAMSAKASTMLVAATDKPTDPQAATDAQVVSSDQLNDVDRALHESALPGPSLAMAAAEAPAAPAAPVTAARSNESSTWDQTSLIGKIFIGFGALLTMASAARMFMA